MKTNQSEQGEPGVRVAKGEQETQTWPQYTTIYNLNQMQLNDQHRRHKSPASWAADGQGDGPGWTESDVDNAAAAAACAGEWLVGSKSNILVANPKKKTDSKGKMQYVIK